jgi:cathepsin B
MKLFLLFCLAAICLAKDRKQAMIDLINGAGTTWRAGHNHRFEKDPQLFTQLLGAKKDARVFPYGESRFLNLEIPNSFDARTKWPTCKSIGTVRDQSSCGSCWAFGAVEAMSDRICIASGGKTNVMLSPADLMSCCTWTCGNGCHGGYPKSAWEYWVRHGIVTGGSKEDASGCKPYPFMKCEHHCNGTHYPPCPHEIYPTPSCHKECQAGYGKKYDDDKYHGKNAYSVRSRVSDIQKEIMTNGPVEVAFHVYEDFEHYKGGIYQHVTGGFKGGHAVKMLGWGVDNGVDYWLIANSWNEDWGEKGFFRILRGNNECGIEGEVVAGMPR